MVGITSVAHAQIARPTASPTRVRPPAPDTTPPCTLGTRLALFRFLLWVWLAFETANAWEVRLTIHARLSYPLTSQTKGVWNDNEGGGDGLLLQGSTSAYSRHVPFVEGSYLLSTPQTGKKGE